MALCCLYAHTIQAPYLFVCDENNHARTYASQYLDDRIITTIHDHIHTLDYTLPEIIPYRYTPNQYVTKTELNDTLTHITNALEKKEYTDIYPYVTILKDDNFNYKTGTGMLIMHLNEHPFVIKLYITNTAMINNPHGIEPYFFMFMNGSTPNHITGLTRITTNKYLKQYIQNNDTYSTFDVPRIWSWMPTEPEWLLLWYVDEKQQRYAYIPKVYAVITDYIAYDKHQTPPTERVFRLFNTTDNAFDPHYGNCVWEKETGKYIIIDTENFITKVGFTEPINTTSYISWYSHLIGTCVSKLLFPRPNQFWR